jgi:hypothetical protein
MAWLLCHSVKATGPIVNLECILSTDDHAKMKQEKVMSCTVASGLEKLLFGAEEHWLTSG